MLKFSPNNRNQVKTSLRDLSQNPEWKKTRIKALMKIQDQNKFRDQNFQKTQKSLLKRSQTLHKPPQTPNSRLLKS